MKILAVSHEFPPIGGGGANACKYLTRGFVEAGHSVTLLTAGFADLFAEETIEGVHIFRVPAKRAHKEHCSFMEMLDYLRLAMPVAKRLQKEQGFDLCLVFFGIPSGPIGRMLKKKYKVPYVIRFGGGDIPGFQKRFTKIYKLIGPAIRSIWKNADARVANSVGLREMAMDFCDKYPFSVVPNGVDIDEYEPLQRTSSIRKPEIRLLFVSRLIERKGLQYILPMLLGLQEKTKRAIKLQVVGDGPYREDLENQVAALGISEMVVFEGQKNKGEIVSFYQNADIFILPSEKEGMPNVVLEAMACGLPVVMTLCQGSEELIHENGYAVPINQFEDRLRILIEDSELRVQMGKKSRKLSEEQFAWNQTVKQYLDIFGELT